MNQHAYSDHTKLYYILKDEKLIVDKWVKPMVGRKVANIGKD